MLLIPIAKKLKYGKQFLTHLHFLLLLFIVITCPGILHSQPIFSPGIVITISGDTLRGEIGEFGGGKNYQECVFRQTPDAVLQRFTPQAINGYVIDNRRYFESRAVNINSNPTTTIFVEYIIKGGTSIVKVRNDFYLLHLADSLQRVPLRQLNSARTKEEYQISRRNWILFLNTLSQDCLGLKYHFGNSKNLESNEKNLIEIIKIYNVCQGTPYEEYGASLPLIEVQTGVSLALDYTNLAFSSTTAPNYLYLLEPDFTTVGPMLGVGMQIWSPRRLNTFSMYIEPSIRAYRLKADIYLQQVQNIREETYYYTEISWLGVGSPMAIRYTLPNRYSSLSFQLGPTVQLFLRPEAETLEEVVAKEFLQERTIVTTNRFAPLEFSEFQVGFGGQINLRKHWDNLPGNWEFALGFQRGGGIALEDTQPVLGLLQSRTTSYFLKAIWLW